MDTPDTTEADTADTSTADAGGAVEILQLMPPTAWEGMLVLGKIATDPKAYRKALRSLHDAAVATTARQDAREKQLDAREKELEAERVEVDQQKKSAASTWATVRSREQAVEAREERCDAREAEGQRGSSPPRNYRHPDDDFHPIEGSGMSRTFTAPRTVRHDDLGQLYAAHTTLTRTTDAE
jgi:hypothetical protein